MIRPINRYCLLMLCVIFISALPKYSFASGNDGNVVSRKNMDTTVSPTVDFYDYAVGTWIKNATIPAAYPAWNAAYIVHDNNYDKLKEILISSEKDKSAAKGSNVQMVGDFFASGMDTVKIEKDGYNPIKPELEKIDNMKSMDDFYPVFVSIFLGYSNPLFQFSAGADAKNSSLNIAQVDQAGLGLPDRDYYLKDDLRSKKIREKYVVHLKTTFMLVGEDSVEAEKDAQTIMNLETDLAKASFTRVELRDPQKTYNIMTYEELKNLVPNFNWDKYFSILDVPAPDKFNVSEPDFMKEVNNLLKNTSMDQWKTYFKWNVVNAASSYLSSKFVDAKFNFYSRVFYGVSEMQPRWKRVLGAINSNIGMSLGQLYVKENFPPSAKTKAVKIVHSLIDEYRVRIKNLDWMSDATKEKAVAKLNAITIKIGYPDKWKDYSGLEINRGSYFGNVHRSDVFATKKNLAKIGKPVDKTEWFMTPQTVNAYYAPQNNEIVFPAGILQPPFFDPKADDAINYGAMGCVIGHEITHGFDDQGRQYDAKGNMEDWWTKSDQEKFDKKAERIVDQFNSFVAIDTIHVNGKLTEGENIADLGGVTISFNAFKNTEEYKDGKKIDGFTPVQRFFLSFANVYKEKIRPQTQMYYLSIDPHSPNKFRVNGPLSNFAPFWKAFDVKKGDAMKRPSDKIVQIW